jgi:hypothetical protein
MTTDRLQARRRAVLAVAGLLGSPTAVADPWYLRVGGRFAGPVARVVSAHPLGLSGSCTLELGASTATALLGLIEGGLSGAGTREDITLFRGRGAGIVGFELSGARVTSRALPRRDAASADAPVVQAGIAWQGRSVSRLPDSVVVAAHSPCAADRAPLAVGVGGERVAAAWASAALPGELALAVPEPGLGLAPGETRPVTVSVGRFAFSFAARLRAVEAPVHRLAVERAALEITPA